DIVDHAVILTAERYRAQLVARQTDKRLTAEFAATLFQRAVVNAEAVFQREDGLKTATQVFGAAQAPAAAVHRTRGFLPVAVAGLVIRIGEAGIDQAVQRDAALGVRRRCQNAREGRDH